MDLKKVFERKLEAARLKKAGTAAQISDKYAAMDLSKSDVTQLIAFLKLLDDVSDKQFRELIIKAEVLDTTLGSE